MNPYCLYAFMTGTGFQIALGLFLVGTTLRVVLFLRGAVQKDKAFFAFYSLKYAVRSMLAHTLPFVSKTSRIHAVTTLITALFHIGIITLTLFHSAHVILIADGLAPATLAWPILPEGVSHILGWLSAAALLLLILRRLVNPTVRYISIARDYLLNLAILLLILSGIWSRMQLPGFFMVGLIHITTGNVLIAITPFTRLSHLFMLPFTRGYIGSEFGKVRHVQDW